MDRFFNRKSVYIPMIILIFLLILYLLVLIRPLIMGIFSFLKEIGLPFVIALIISYLLSPIVNRLVNLGLNRGCALALIYIAFFSGLGLLLYWVIPVLIQQIKEFNEHMPEIMKQLQKWMDIVERNQDHWPDGVRKGLENGFHQLDLTISEWIGQLVNGIGGMMKYLTTAMLIPFIVYYMLKDYDHFQEKLMRFFPKAQRKKILILLRDINEGLSNYISGQMLVSTFVGVLVYLGYLLIGFPYPLMFGFISMIFNIIPYLGPFLGTIPAMVVAITVSWKLALYVILVNSLVQTIEGNFLSPIIVGRTTHLHPLSIILAILIGGTMAGIPGLIFAVPVLVALKVIVYRIVNHYVHGS